MLMSSEKKEAKNMRTTLENRKKAYEILHEIDGGLNQLNRQLNWQKIKSNDPRLKKVRKLLGIETKPAKKEKVITHRSETIKYDDEKILELINKGYSLEEMGAKFKINRNTLYAHIRKNAKLNACYQDMRLKFSTIIASKKGKIYAKGTVSEIAEKLGIKRSSISFALSQEQRTSGYSFTRLKNWEETRWNMKN